MYDNSYTRGLYEHRHPSQVFKLPNKMSETIGAIHPLESDDLVVLDSVEEVTMMALTQERIHVSPQALAITPPGPASPSIFDTDSVYSDDGFNSASSFMGEECPDLCGGPKNSCRSWTPPASPFYYTDEGGIFLLDDRKNYEERQKVELEHTLRDLDGRLQWLRETMSPPRFLSRLHEETWTPLPPSEESYRLSESFPQSSAETLSEDSFFTEIAPEPHTYDCDGTLRRCKLPPSQKSFVDSPHDTAISQGKDETGTTDLGSLLHNSLQHVQSTNSPPRFTAYVPETEARPLLRDHIITPKSNELRHQALLMRHASPHLRSGKTAYPTPLPSSPESKPSRKRGRDECYQESSGRKRRREEDEDSTLTR